MKLTYEKLITFYPPKPIYSKEQCIDAELIIEELLKEKSIISPEYADYIYVLTVLIDDYKNRITVDPGSFVKATLDSW